MRSRKNIKDTIFNLLDNFFIPIIAAVSIILVILFTEHTWNNVDKFFLVMFDSVASVIITTSIVVLYHNFSFKKPINFVIFGFLMLFISLYVTFRYLDMIVSIVEKIFLSLFVLGSLVSCFVKSIKKNNNSLC